MRVTWFEDSKFNVNLDETYVEYESSKKYFMLLLLNKAQTKADIPSEYMFYNFEHFWSFVCREVKDYFSDIHLYWFAALSGCLTTTIMFQSLLIVEGITYLHLHDYLFTFKRTDAECMLIVDWCAWFYGVKACFLKFCHLAPQVYHEELYLVYILFSDFLSFFFFLSAVLSFIVIFVIHIILSLIITITIASLTLVERRVLSLVQRRVGPNQVGFRGRLQFIADALKLLLKGITIPDLTNRKLFVFIPALSLFVCYTFWLNTVWGPNLSVVELEYNLVYAALMSSCFSICIVLTGIFSRNKYSILASVRCCCMALNLEILFGFLILYITAASESFSFSAAVHSQSGYFYLIFVLAPVLPVVLITFLLETNRAPFDLTEAESELVAGYTTELGGFFFALFYLGEYFHLFFFSLTLSLCLLGGWF